MKRLNFADKVATKTSNKPRENCVVPDDINDIKGAINENANICEYSTNEQLIGKFNGKNLYRKMLSYNYGDLTLTSNTSSNIAFNINFSDISANLDDWWLDYNKSNITSGVLKAFLSPSTSAQFKQTANTGTAIMFSTNTTYYKSGCVVTIVVEYTKTS